MKHNKTMKQNKINHIAFVLDASSSMSGLEKQVIQVLETQVSTLAQQSKELDQETRVSIYSFANSVQNIVFDKDVLRLPSIASEYRTNGMTALIDATIKSVLDLSDTSVLYGDHAFLVYVITDGDENRSSNSPSRLKDVLSKLEDNWTVAALVPNEHGENLAIKYGFNPGNVMAWDATSNGLKAAADKISSVTRQYMVDRLSGSRGTKTLFQIDTSLVKSEQVNRKLDALLASSFEVLTSTSTAAEPIRQFVESKISASYVIGSAYYELIKKEEIQPQKKILIQNKISGYVYSGDQARQMLGLPNQSIYVKPEAASKFHIFVQSTSVNRKIIPGQRVIVLK